MDLRVHFFDIGIVGLCDGFHYLCLIVLLVVYYVGNECGHKVIFFINNITFDMEKGALIGNQL